MNSRSDDEGMISPDVWAQDRADRENESLRVERGDGEVGSQIET
jgi:hypothetical protein